MRAEIRRLQRRLGVTSLYVTHDQAEAMTLGDRLLVLHQGRPEHPVQGDELSLLVEPIEPLGSETLVHGHLTGGEEQSLVVKLPGAAPGGERLGVRLLPEHLHVFDRASGQRIEPIGHESPSLRLAAADTAV